MATLATTLVQRTGVALPAGSAATATTGDKFQPGDDVFLIVKTTGTTCNVTVTSVQQGPEAQNLDSPNAVAVGATATVMFGPFPVNRFAGSDGYATVVCSAVTGVTVAAVRVPKN